MNKVICYVSPLLNMSKKIKKINILNSISIEIYKLSFVNLLSFLKEDTNNEYFSIIMSSSKFNITLKN